MIAHIFKIKSHVLTYLFLNIKQKIRKNNFTFQYFLKIREFIPISFAPLLTRFILRL